MPKTTYQATTEKKLKLVIESEKALKSPIFTPDICIVGLGYVGIPLAVEFAKNKVKVSGFDVNEEKVNKLNQFIDTCDQIDTEVLKGLSIPFSLSPDIIKKSNFIIVAVPTPIDQNKKPDLTAVKKASETVGKNLSKGAIVVYESTVYPGVTEEICMPILEQASGLKCGRDFFIGYSPERVNPGDEIHTIDQIVKVVSGMDEHTTEIVAGVYSTIIKAGVFKAANIKTAEAAKVIENIQRDLNIALFNELALIFDKLGIKTGDVVEAADTKWNFHRYHPGLVGGHCIGVDPYYLVYKAQELGYDPQILLAGRRVNESMASFVVEKLIRMMIKADKRINKSKVLLMGLTFKENINDVRNSKAAQLIAGLHSYGVEVIGFEPHCSADEIRKEFGIQNHSWENIPQVDAVILFNKHKTFETITPEVLKSRSIGTPVLFDVKDHFDSKELDRLGFIHSTL